MPAFDPFARRAPALPPARSPDADPLTGLPVEEMLAARADLNRALQGGAWRAAFADRPAPAGWWENADPPDDPRTNALSTFVAAVEDLPPTTFYSSADWMLDPHGLFADPRRTFPEIIEDYARVEEEAALRAEGEWVGTIPERAAQVPATRPTRPIQDDLDELGLGEVLERRDIQPHELSPREFSRDLNALGFLGDTPSETRRGARQGATLFPELRYQHLVRHLREIPETRRFYDIIEEMRRLRNPQSSALDAIAEAAERQAPKGYAADAAFFDDYGLRQGQLRDQDAIDRGFAEDETFFSDYGHRER